MKVVQHLKDRLEMLTPPLPWDKPHQRHANGPRVILLHGLWRGWRAMEPLARELQRAGFSTLNIPYPSARMPVDILATYIRSEIEKLNDDRPLHFITHSLGAILLRMLYAHGVSWDTGRVVMLAPPNAGSEIVDWVNKHPPLHRILGPAGSALHRAGLPYQLPGFPAPIEAAIIMGNRSSIPFFRKLLSTENDGIVSTKSGHLQGVQHFKVIPADHTFIQLHPDTLRLTIPFLKSAAWPSD